MGCQVILAPRAVRDLEAIVRYISANDSQAAFGFVTRNRSSKLPVSGTLLKVSCESEVL